GLAGLPVAAVGGHNWQFDQGSTTCKAGNTGTPGAAASGWTIPPNTTTDCFVLPVVKLGPQGNIIFQNFGTVPITSQAIVTPCVSANLPTVALTPNPLNTRLNQLGCSISRVDTGLFTDRDQTTAPAYMATASIRGGLFMERLD